MLKLIQMNIWTFLANNIEFALQNLHLLLYYFGKLIAFGGQNEFW